MDRTLALAALAACAIALSACGGGDGGATSAPPPAAAAPPASPPPPAPPPPPPDTTAPTVPANVTAVAQSATSILVSWEASTDASGVSGYRVYRDGAATEIGDRKSVV